METDLPIERTPITGSSLMDTLRAKHRELSDSKTIDVPLPGYEDVLVARYRTLDVQNELSRISKRVAREKAGELEAQVHGALDILATACVEIFVLINDEPQPMCEAKAEDGSFLFGEDAPPIRYDDRFAEFMGFTGVTSTREIILALWADVEPMILEHAQLLSRWMSNTTRRINDTLMEGM